MKNKFFKLVILTVCLVMAFSFVACGVDTDEYSNDIVIDSNEYENPYDDWVESAQFDDTYTPTTFNTTSVSQETIMEVDGVKVIAIKYTLNTGNDITVYATEINLFEVDIVNGGTLENGTFTKDTPYGIAESYKEANPDKEIYAFTNADFFGLGVVNANVQDGLIINESHKDAGESASELETHYPNYYDYTADISDVPASAPMLFGTNGYSAQIEPIIEIDGDPTDWEVKRELVKSKLSYNAYFNGYETKHSMSSNSYDSTDTKSLALVTKSSMICYEGDTIVRFSGLNGDGQRNMVQSVIVLDSQTTVSSRSGEFIIIPSGYEYSQDISSLAEGDRMYFTVTNDTDNWDNYETIIGARQALVIDGEIPSTVALENTNGAQTTDVPRTAVGIKEDGRVVLFAVESLYYYNRDSEGDTHGLNLPQLADFIAYYNCTDACNFDGGGSTQLIAGETFADAEVLVRSADYGTYELEESRLVYNTFMVVSKD